MSVLTEKATAANVNEASMADFLNPNSMLTPGFAGAVTMMITNVLCTLFAIPVALTGLAISALFGTLVVVSAGSLFRKSIYYVLNSLIIFCVAMGSGTIAYDIERKAALRQITLSYAGSARAQTLSDDGTTSEHYINALEKITNDPTLTAAQKMKKIADFNKTWNSEQLSNLDPKHKSDGFFKSWSITGK